MAEVIIVEPTPAEEMVTVLETALAANPLVDQVTVDGQTVKYNRAQAMRELEFWRKKVAKEGGKSRFRSINISGAW